MEKIEPTYDPKNYEKRIWDTWIKHELFHADKKSGKKPYGILMPPPNVTAQLHMGHGTCYTFQDILIRWHRMRGYASCWLPGTDHAGIATQMMVEKDLEKAGTSRKEMGREAFVERCQEWKEKYGGLIYDQFEKIGFSADWQRKAYTMDPHLSKAVRHVFVSLYKEGLIYRGERLVNWDPVLKTAISDDEIENKELNGHLWHLRYPLADDPNTHIIVATTRPETMLGDTAVAVHPDDERYKALVGKMIRLPLTQRLIPIVADDYVKSEFGSGAVKITPAHDPNDFEIGKRHNLPMLEIFNDDATMAESVPEAFRGLDRFAARKEVIRAFKKLDLFEKEEHYKHTVPHSDRSKSVIEPKLSLQWYVKMQSMAKPAADAARDGTLNFYPDVWKKTYLYWLDNVQDWCISRQLWWGHRIPIWYCQDCQEVTCETEDPSTCVACGSKNLKQDEDVLDTWFSSWLWPLSPFGWPDEKREQQEDFDFFYPTNVLMTGPDIIFLWVARMIMAGLKFKGAVPFKDLYFSAIVTDKQGRKFSKTLGNGIDPIEVIEKHGADAVRFTGASLAPLGGRIGMEVDDFEMGARFVNKLWNAARFILGHVNENLMEGDRLILKPLHTFEPDMPSQWLLSELAKTAKKVHENFSSYRLNDGVDAIYHYIWGSLCDWGLECSKNAWAGSNIDQQKNTLSVLIYCFEGALRLLHPIMPFVTEELWQKIDHHPDWQMGEKPFLAVAPYPEEQLFQLTHQANIQKDAADWQTVIDLITSIRSARQQVGIPPKQQLKALVQVGPALKDAMEKAKPWIGRLANIEDLSVAEKVTRPPHSLVAVGRGFEAYLPVAGLVDFDKEKKRIEAEITRIDKIVSGIEKKLSNKNFVDRAPAEVVASTQAQKENMQSQLDALRVNLEAMR